MADDGDLIYLLPLQTTTDDVLIITEGVATTAIDSDGVGYYDDDDDDVGDADNASFVAPEAGIDNYELSATTEPPGGARPNDECTREIICGYCERSATYAVSDPTCVQIQCLYCGRKSKGGERRPQEVDGVTMMLFGAAAALIVAIVGLLGICLAYRMDWLSISLPIIGALFIAVGYVCSLAASKRVKATSGVGFPL
ncbi:PREDICTED: uncharacterized protein LOC106808851 [Priapulus caudatus]|uniref:Uncharacterized protein LOC106808851 n=1 Tax=Priapulus caudatus TaxID=37621 RepID=A0ABM1E4V1_PRICU|nr:PREDICTED: uncharacterized protein LOC106808851 [Priapulus caudatus]